VSGAIVMTRFGLPAGTAAISSDGPQPYAIYVDETGAVWVNDWGANAILRFDPKTEKFVSFPLSDRYAGVRQLAAARAKSGVPSPASISCSCSRQSRGGVGARGPSSRLSGGGPVLAGRRRATEGYRVGANGRADCAGRQEVRRAAGGVQADKSGIDDAF
jgi:hypothetical protein